MAQILNKAVNLIPKQSDRQIRILYNIDLLIFNAFSVTTPSCVRKLSVIFSSSTLGRSQRSRHNEVQWQTYQIQLQIMQIQPSTAQIEHLPTSLIQSLQTKFIRRRLKLRSQLHLIKPLINPNLRVDVLDTKRLLKNAMQRQGKCPF